MDTDAKIRPLYLLQILKERTDEDHYLTTAQICRILKEEYHLETHRTTVKGDYEVLKKAGFDVYETRSTQNQYRYIDREFDIAELKTVIDAVASSKFISEEKSGELIQKITSLAGNYKALELKCNVTAEGRGKLDNRQIFYIIDAINDAINAGKKISFRKVEYNLAKERVLHNGGERYVFSPYSLVWDGDRYYVVGFSEKYGKIGSHRVDRIAERPEILEEDAEPQPSDFDAAEYMRTYFRMNGGPLAKVELLCDKGVIDAIIDHFGPDVEILEGNRRNFRVIEELAAGTVFFNWIFGFEGKVKILGPENVKEEYRMRLKNAAKKAK